MGMVIWAIFISRRVFCAALKWNVMHWMILYCMYNIRHFWRYKLLVWFGAYFSQSQRFIRISVRSGITRGAILTDYLITFDIPISHSILKIKHVFVYFVDICTPLKWNFWTYSQRNYAKSDSNIKNNQKDDRNYSGSCDGMKYSEE